MSTLLLLGMSGTLGGDKECSGEAFIVALVYVLTLVTLVYILSTENKRVPEVLYSKWCHC